jgi:hypothetical protein
MDAESLQKADSLQILRRPAFCGLKNGAFARKKRPPDE